MTERAPRAVRLRRPPRRTRRTGRARDRRLRAPRRSRRSTRAACSRDAGPAHRSSDRKRSPQRCSTAGPSAANASSATSFSARAPRLPPKTSSTRPVLGQLEPTAGLGGGDLLRQPERPADHAVLRAVSPRHRIREEDAAGEGSGQPVRQAQVGVGLGQGCRDPPAPGGEDHRARDVAASAVDDVRPPLGQDPGARAGCPPRQQHRPCLREPRAPRQARDPERRRTESRPPAPAGLRSGQASRRSSRARRGRGALPRRRATASRGRLFPRLRSRT